MSDTPPPPDWLPYAQDCLKDRGLDAAADWLDAFARLLPLMEAEVRATLSRRAGLPADPVTERVVEIIALGRGETPEAALDRLRPPPRIDRPESGLLAMRRLREIVPDAVEVIDHGPLIAPPSLLVRRRDGSTIRVTQADLMALDGFPRD